MNSRNAILSKYFDAKVSRRRKAAQREKRLKAGLPAAVALKHVSLDQKQQEAISTVEAIGTAKRKKLFVTRHFAWPVSLGVHAFVALLITIYAVHEYMPEEVPIFLDFMEPVREPRKQRHRPPMRGVKPPDSVQIQAPRVPQATPTVEVPTEGAQIFHAPIDDLGDGGAGPSVGAVSIPQGLGIPVQQKRAEIPTELGVKIERDTQILPEDNDLDNISEAGLDDRSIDAEVSVQVDQEPRPLRKPNPKYPEAALRANKEDVVTLEATIGVDGKATDIKVVKPKGFGFDEAAVEALKKARYTPAKRGGKAVPRRVRIRIRFTLDD